MTPEEQAVIAKVIARAVHNATQPFIAKVTGLERTVAELQARPSVKDAGPWKPAVTYGVGDLITHEGSGWICGRGHTSTTTFDFTMWRLFVKKGSNGKDLR